MTDQQWKNMDWNELPFDFFATKSRLKPIEILETFE